jgi:hypothetical protein
LYHVFGRKGAHNPLNGVGGSNPALAKWASAKQCAGRSLVKVGGTYGLKTFRNSGLTLRVRLVVRRTMLHS